MNKRKVFILLCILLGALCIRLPQLNFPAIGYHNMKENEYIGMAKLMLASGDFFTRQTYFITGYSHTKDYGVYPQIPIVAYQVALGFKLCGDDSLWFGRLINILYMLGAILVFFAIVSRLTGNFIYAATAAFLFSVFPISVFSSRNLQPEAAALLCMLLGQLFWLKFLNGFNRRNLIIAGCFFGLTSAFKMAFLVGLVPLLFLIPVKLYLGKKGWKQAFCDAGLFILPFLVFLGYFLIKKQFVFASVVHRVSLFNVFSRNYWLAYGHTIIKYQVLENFGLLFTVLTISGMLISWVKVFSDRSLFVRYLRGWSVAAVFYWMVFSDYICRHNYYQFPLLAMAAVSVVYVIKIIADIPLEKARKFKMYLFMALFFFVFSFSLSGIEEGMVRQFATYFPCGDVAGRILKKELLPGERFAIFATDQGYSPSVYAEHLCESPHTVGQFREAEARGLRFVVVNRAGMFDALSEGIKNYLQSNYHLYAMAVKKKDNVIQFIILKRGGVFDKNKLSIKKGTAWTVAYTTMAGTDFFAVTQNAE